MIYVLESLWNVWFSISSVSVSVLVSPPPTQDKCLRTPFNGFRRTQILKETSSSSLTVISIQYHSKDDISKICSRGRYATPPSPYIFYLQSNAPRKKKCGWKLSFKLIFRHCGGLSSPLCCLDSACLPTILTDKRGTMPSNNRSEKSQNWYSSVWILFPGEGNLKEFLGKF